MSKEISVLDRYPDYAVNIGIEVHAQLKALSQRTGRSMQEIAREAIQIYLAKESQAAL